MQDIHQLRNLILKAKHAYYYSGEPIMSDAEYDALEDQLRQLAPEDPVLALVGAPVSGDSMLTKASHSIPMGSQSKVNSEEEFRQWLLKGGGGRVHASLKGDGGSAAAYYRDGQLVQAITRGDGTIGEDITANALRFKGLPAWVGTAEGGFTGAVRFEVILTVEDWTRLDPSRSKNPRNAGNGIMGRKNGHQSDLLTTYAFDIDEVADGSSKVFRSEAEKAQRLTELGFNVIPHRLCEDADQAVAYFQEIASTRESLPFWIDGVVIKLDDIARQNELGVISGRPRGQVAWKFDSAGVETVVEGVVISGGHTGALIPTAQLKPVDIGGTTVSSASLANFEEIERLDVAVGDSIWLIKANDIIPKIVRVTERPAHRQPILRPVSCPFCGGEVGRRTTTDGKEGAIVECRNGDCPKKSIGKINRWISSLDILGIGDVVLEALVEHFDMEDAADLYSLKDKAEAMAALVTHKERLLTLGEKRTANILAAIDAKRTLTLSQFLGSLGLEHLGKRRVELMIRAAQGDLDTLEDWRAGHLRQAEFAEKAGVPNIGSAIQDAIDAMSPTIDKMQANGVEILPPQEDIHAEADQAERKTVCISGKLPSGKKKADYEAPLKAAGYELVDDVSKGLTYLVLADPDSTSSKAVKARKLGIEIISEDGLDSLTPSTGLSHSLPTSSLKSSDTMTTEQLKRYFEFQDEKSAKFWEVTTDGAAVTVRYGKIGTNGQTQEKVFSDTAAASKHVDKLISEKTGKGYLEIVGNKSSSPSKSENSNSHPKPKAKEKVTKNNDLKSSEKAFKPIESYNGAKPAGEFEHYKDTIEFAVSVGHLTRESYDYVLEVGDTVNIPQPVFGQIFKMGTVLEILEHDDFTKDILGRNESFCAFNEDDENLLDKHLNLWGQKWERTLSTDAARTCIIRIREPFEISPSVIKSLERRFPDGDFSKLANDDVDTHDFHFDGIDVKLSRTGEKKFDADIRVKSLLDGGCLRERVEIENFKQAILENEKIENLAWSDNIIPQTTLDALNEQVDIICAQEPEDFHPGSGTVVRDLVHPSMYCFVNGVSNVSISPLSNYSSEFIERHREESDTDFWGRIYEDSKYQWLPAEFVVDDQGKVTINSYINNLDESKYPRIYELIAEIFGRLVPMFESICTGLKNNFADYNESKDLKNIPLRNRKLQVVTKLVEYRVNKEEEFEGVWHVEGMSHENILATGLCIIKRDVNFMGADIAFKRYLFSEEADNLISSTVQNAARPTEQMDGGDVRPLGTAKTPAGRALVWPNSHIHKVSKMDSSDGKDATRRILVFWLVNPDTPIVSTANVPKQQGQMTLAQAKKNRLALMKDRTKKKDRYNDREVFLCEH